MPDRDRMESRHEGRGGMPCITAQSHPLEGRAVEAGDVRIHAQDTDDLEDLAQTHRLRILIVELHDASRACATSTPLLPREREVQPELLRRLGTRANHTWARGRASANASTAVPPRGQARSPLALRRLLWRHRHVLVGPRPFRNRRDRCGGCCRRCHGIGHRSPTTLPGPLSCRGAGPSHLPWQWHAVASATLTQAVAAQELHTPPWSWVNALPILAGQKAFRCRRGTGLLGLPQDSSVNLGLKDVLHKAAVAHQAERWHGLCKSNVVEAGDFREALLVLQAQLAQEVPSLAPLQQRGRCFWPCNCPTALLEESIHDGEWAGDLFRNRRHDDQTRASEIEGPPAPRAGWACA
mmetsp:Transcript_97051/g.216474  ORF Transcript_97051/g.216474 Transcript_97051/m.216474 type:complete len:352 (-) Transcript_97051:28-1083(-)